MTGVLLGSRSFVRAARDEEELRGVRRYRLVASVVVVLFAVGMPIRVLVTGWRYWAAVDFVAFVLALAWLQHVWLHRVISRRLEAEMREDPVRAAAQRRRERRGAIIGWSLGLTFGTLGLVAGLWFSNP